MWVFYFFSWFNKRYRKDDSNSVENILLALAFCIFLALGCSTVI
jgi:hypothetical protein